MLSNSRNFYVVEIPYNVFNEMYLPSIYRTMGIARALQVGSIYLKNQYQWLHTNEYNKICRHLSGRFTRYLPLTNEKCKLD